MDKERLKQELLEELKKEYVLTPIKEARFTLNDILERYYRTICEKCDIPPAYTSRQTINGAIRKAVCMHFGYSSLKVVPSDKRMEFREELERFIQEYILGGK